ncbi:hypothetical protein FOCC_FOCC008986 [Frankliniella occidentalis]|nr:hypothetical protein FOCC_FOCC008986 [Frankliniella occidentalis]
MSLHEMKLQLELQNEFGDLEKSVCFSSYFSRYTYYISLDFDSNRQDCWVEQKLRVEWVVDGPPDALPNNFTLLRLIEDPAHSVR